MPSIREPVRPEAVEKAGKGWDWGWGGFQQLELEQGVTWGFLMKRPKSQGSSEWFWERVLGQVEEHVQDLGRVEYIGF